MGTVNWSVWSVISGFGLLLVLLCSCEALLCHTCDVDDCKTFNKKNEPKNCTVDDLTVESQSSSLLRNLTHIPFSPIHIPTPVFVCQKIDAENSNGEMQVLRRCAISLKDDQICDVFRENHKKFGEKEYKSVNCTFCETDGCNSSGLNFIWIPLLVFSIILSILK